MRKERTKSEGIADGLEKRADEISRNVRVLRKEQTKSEGIAGGLEKRADEI